LPSILKEWVNEKFALYIFIELQVANFPLSHLVAEGWYLDLDTQDFKPPTFSNAKGQKEEIR
jgi:hypothetical protein